MKGAPRRVAYALLAMHALWGCAHRADRVQAARAAALPPAADALDLQFEAIAAELESTGLRRGALRERGFLPPSGRVSYPVHLERDECAVFVALATASMADLDASLFTPEGAVLVEDDGTGTRPALTFCASPVAPLDGYLTLHAYQGAGSYVAGQFRRARAAGDDLHTATAPGQVASELGQLAQTLHERGFEDAAPRVSIPLGSGAVRMAVHVDAGECYTLAAEGGAGLAELGLRLVDARGGELASGVGEPSLAALQYCANDRAELALELVAKRGQGVAQVARFRVAQSALGGARALWLGEPSPSPQAWSRAKTPQPERSSSPAPFYARQLPLRQGEVIELSVEPQGARCERWQAQLEPGLSLVTMRLESERGELLGEVDSQVMQACAVVCAAAGPRRVTLVGRTGFGAVSLTARSLTAPDATLLEKAGLVFDARACHGSSAPVESPPQVEARGSERMSNKAR